MDLKLTLDGASTFATVALAALTGWLAWGTAKIAREAHESSRSADRLYNLQVEAMAREEHAAKPNLHVVDVDRVRSQTHPPGIMPPLLVDLRNFGKRSLRIIKMELRGPNGVTKYAEERSRPVVHAGETVVVQIDKAINIALAGQVAAFFQGADEEIDAESAEAEARLATTLTLLVTFTEVDGSGETEQSLIVNTMGYRGNWHRTDFTYTMKD